MKIAIDAMGGDHAPQAVVDGAIKAIDKIKGIEITLFGDKQLIDDSIPEQYKTQIKVIHTDEKIDSNDDPVKAVRKKRNSSMVLATKEVKEQKVDACISAGNTGALIASGLFNVGRIKGIDRPGFAPTFPTIDGKGFLMLDVGANSDAKPSHLLQYAIMGSIYSEKVRGIAQPKIGLLNIGTEENKGNELTKNAYELLSQSSLNFVGNVEARDLLNGVADVVVTDGFTGNVALKAIEGTAMSIFSMLKEELTSSLPSKLAASILKPQLKNLKAKLDYSEYGGAGLFGLKYPVIKAHGSSDGQAMFSAIQQASEMVTNNVCELIESAVNER
ncbi:phosphate acyltransferase PlsX [Bacillus carboniphilus]|uniref:Phosphate acyltransferase n=1 Tax=Bacillus carboniphilus TaxID=86663 RepID=A0ABY9K149_9BACI|nr:phosphate acyltransferase PlsX [Bacillus carboniphilus]WLR43565.1 phosphate acyltransferase PlsX [Bacillus carboniphilus]